MKMQNASLVSTGIKPSKVKLAPLASSVDKTAPSEDIPALTNAYATASTAAPAAAATAVSKKTNVTNSEEELAPLTPPVPKSAPSEDTLPPTDAPVTASAAALATAGTVKPVAGNKTDNEVKSASMTPPIPETVPSEDISVPANGSATTSAAAPAAATTVKLEVIDKRPLPISILETIRGYATPIIALEQKDNLDEEILEPSKELRF
jgi:hypothetical protein